MSTAPQSPNPGAPSGTVMVPIKQEPAPIRIYGHSTLFYWWPVWACGFLFVLISLVDSRALFIPSGTEITVTEGIEKNKNNEDVKAVTYHLKNSKFKNDPAHPDLIARYMTPPERPGESAEEKKERESLKKDPPRISHYPWMGSAFCILLVVVIAITNIPLRGLWSLIVIVTVILVVVILILAGVWDSILYAVGNLHIYIGMAGYLFMSTALLFLWIISMFIFDRQIYVTFETGQMKMCEEVGGGERSYDTVGMAIEKHRDDLFRHWVLGLGSGDLTIRTSGANPHQFTLNNVLFLNWKLKQIEQMQREKQIRVD